MAIVLMNTDTGEILGTGNVITGEMYLEKIAVDVEVFDDLERSERLFIKDAEITGLRGPLTHRQISRFLRALPLKQRRPPEKVHCWFLFEKMEFPIEELEEETAGIPDKLPMDSIDGFVGAEAVAVEA